MKYYVYILRDPCPGKDLQPIYVGQGSRHNDASMRRHWILGQRHSIELLGAAFGEFRAAGLKVHEQVVARFATHEEALRREIDLIALYGRRHNNTGPLYNLTSGGEGADPELVRIGVRRRLTDPVVVKVLEERGRMLGLRAAADPEITALAQAAREAWHCDPANAERKAELAELARQQMIEFNTPEVRQASSEFCKARNADEEYTANRLATVVAWHEDNKEVHSENTRKAVSDDEAQARRLASYQATIAERPADWQSDPARFDPKLEKARKQNAAAVARRRTAIRKEPALREKHLQKARARDAKRADRRSADRRAKRLAAGLPLRDGPRTSNPRKLTADQVLAIRADTRPRKLIAAEFGCSQSMVSKIKTRKVWQHL